jgi:sugar transferase (PEP-CTERM/EpsH1 system associated)
LADSARPILYLVHRLPFPPDKGDRIRAFHLLKFLAQQGPIHLAALADEPVTELAQESLTAVCEELAIVPLPLSRRLRMAWSLAAGRTASEGAFDSPRLRDILRAWCRRTRYGACLVSASSMVPYLGLPELKGIPAVVDLVDVDSQKWFDYAAVAGPPRSRLYRLEGRRLRRLEAELPSWTRAVTLVSEAEAELFRAFARPGRVEVVTNGVDLEYFQPQEVELESGCVFVGALDYYPNVDGVVWFCREVWPAIRRHQPEARFWLVGRRPVAAVRRLARIPGVEVVGQVPDVRPHYARAAVVIAPLRIARGVQNKLLEAMAMGKALLASPSTLAGLNAQPEVHFLRADSPLDWQEGMLRLMVDKPFRKHLGVAGRHYVEENHSWDRCLQPMGELLHEVTETATCSQESS